MTEKSASFNTKAENLNFTYFPGFAGFILENHIKDYVLEQIVLSREVNLPLMKLFAHMTDEQILEIGLPGHSEFLSYARNNNLKELLDTSLRKWKEDQLEIIGQHDIAAEDITLGSYIRKQAMLKLLPLYTNDPFEIIEIIKEIDIYDSISSTESANLYINLLKDRINEHTHFIESITNTTPGLNYVYNIAENRLVYGNKNYLNYFGYTLDELSAMGADGFRQLIHPDDLEPTALIFKRFAKVENNQVISWEQRLKNYKGEFKWIRNHASVFKRDADGTPIEIVGIALDVDVEKRTAEELLKSEESLLEAQALADMGNFEMDIETEQLSVSPNFHKLTGLPHQFSRSLYLEGVHPGDKAAVNEAIKRAIQENGIYDSEYRYLINGEERIFWSRGKVDIKEGRKVLRGTLMDVTQRRHMIQQLQRSEMLYKQAQALARIGNWSWFIATNRVQWSEELYHIFEIEGKSESITYEKYLSYIHPEDKQLMVSTLEESLKTHQPYDVTHRIILSDGKEKVIQSKGEVLLTEEGAPYKMIGTGQDITEKYYTEQKLREKQEFIQKIANTSPSLIATYNIHTGKYTYLNSAFTKILGYDIGEVEEKGVSFFMSILHPEDVAQITEKNTKALEEANNGIPDDGNEPVVEFKYRLKHKDGNYKWFHTYGTIFDRNENGKVEHILNVSVDITEQEEAEQALHRQNILLQQSNTSLEEYAYVASHDLKEPLRKIATFGDRILSTQYEQLDAQGKIFVDKIIDSARRMQTMISDLLSVSVISGNKAFAACDLNDILNDARGALEFKIEEKKAIIEADNLPVANIVASQFRQLFQNLISNSLKFAKEGVTPVISIKCKYLLPSQAHDPNMAIAKRYLSIAFADNGIGFDNQYANKIFTIFQRLHSKTEYEGNGIGLAICRKIAENHGGTIFANGVINQGATFTVIIPA